MIFLLNSGPIASPKPHKWHDLYKKTKIIDLKAQLSFANSKIMSNFATQKRE